MVAPSFSLWRFLVHFLGTEASAPAGIPTMAERVRQLIIAMRQVREFHIFAKTAYTCPDWRGMRQGRG
jgi:hypothetical protein